ncbi:MAG: Ig-like domain-containing protein, partial [Actinomycetia bacterium]|nr:Ig-like domain-containing protein [Actinomycetes bacterium]
MFHRKRREKITAFAIILAIVMITVGNIFPLFDSILSKIKKSLSTEPGLSIIAVTPMGQTTGIREMDAITVIFDEPVIALSALSEIITNGPIKLIPETTGTYKWLGTSTLAFYPGEDLVKNIRYRATVEKGIKSITGKELKEDFEWYFETVRPKLKYSLPYNNKKWITLDSYIFLYFDSPMELDNENILLKENGESRGFSARYIKTNELDYWRKRNFITNSAVVIMPDNEFLKGSKIELLVEPGYSAVQGDLGTEKRSRIYFYTYYDFRYTGETFQNILPENYKSCDLLKIPFTNPVEFRELYNHIHFDPEIKLDKERYENSTWSDDEFCFYVNYKPETDYTLVIDKELKDIFGQELDEDIEIRFSVGSYYPYFSMARGMGVIEGYEGRKIPVKLRNPEKISIQAMNVDKDSVIPQLLSKKYFNIDYRLKHTYGYLENIKDEWDFIEPFRPKGERNKIYIRPVYLEKYLEGDGSGFLELRMTGSHYGENRTYNTFVQVTELGITGKFSAETNLFFITDLKNGEPVSRAEVEIRDDYNKVLWKGKT